MIKTEQGWSYREVDDVIERLLDLEEAMQNHESAIDGGIVHVTLDWYMNPLDLALDLLGVPVECVDVCEHRGDECGGFDCEKPEQFCRDAYSAEWDGMKPDKAAYMAWVRSEMEHEKRTK